MKESKKTDIARYKQSKPDQLSLFEIIDPSLEDYSNSIELYDTMPKYYLGGVEREKGKTVESLPILNREFVHRNKSYKLDISPAAINDKKTGKTIYYYPSQREELVEDALRKIATRGGSVQFDDKVGVKFSYYEVQQELLKSGHGYSIAQIKLAIEILSKAGLEIVQKDGNEVSITSNFFGFVGKETKEMAGKERVVVIFHSLVTRSINEGTYRLFNYEKLMKMKMPLARWLHKRISHIFSQASADNPYAIKLSTIVRDSGMKAYKTLSERRRQVEKAFEELHERNVVSRFEAREDREKNKILDILYKLYLTEEFVADSIKANAVTNLRLAPPKIGEVLDLTKVRQEIEKPIYQLSKTYINNLLSKISDIEELNNILDSLQSAKNYIENKKGVNAAAVTKSAIKEQWKAASMEEKVDIVKLEKINLEQESIKQELEGERVSSINLFQGKWLEIEKKLKNVYGEDVYNKWISSLKLYSYIDNELKLEAPDKFLRDWLTNEYLENKDKKFKDIIFAIVPDCKNVRIICNS